jgi:hypothetical protein
MRGQAWWWMLSEVGPWRGCKTYFQKVKKMKKMNLFFFLHRGVVADWCGSPAPYGWMDHRPFNRGRCLSRDMVSFVGGEEEERYSPA